MAYHSALLDPYPELVPGAIPSLYMFMSASTSDLDWLGTFQGIISDTGSPHLLVVRPGLDVSVFDLFAAGSFSGHPQRMPGPSLSGDNPTAVLSLCWWSVVFCWFPLFELGRVGGRKVQSKLGPNMAQRAW